ncbi:hypothetical protein M9X92_002173 [Pyricularia oryzae]|nr:hypothetical protein M9X92_002173 [Pyricularia oryzae]
MSNIAAYTPLESFLLFKALYARGVSAAVFDDISADLINYEFIKDDATYDVTRLSPASLQELFLHLLRDELKLNVDTSDKVSDGSLSPNKRRKLHAPTPRNLQEAAEHLPKVPNVLQRLYKEWRAHRITSILEDEQRFEQISAEIAKAEKEAAPTTKNGAGDAAPQSQPAVPSPTPRTTPAPQVRKDTDTTPTGIGDEVEDTNPRAGTVKCGCGLRAGYSAVATTVSCSAAKVHANTGAVPSTRPSHSTFGSSHSTCDLDSSNHPRPSGIYPAACSITSCCPCINDGSYSTTSRCAHFAAVPPRDTRDGA